MGFILSVDVGTTNIKAGVVDFYGKVVKLSRRSSTVVRQEDGTAEHDPENLYKKVCECAREASQDYKGEISLLVLSVYQFGLVLLDKDFKPLTGISTFLDTRAQQTFSEFSEIVDARNLYHETGCPPIFQYPLARLFYYRSKFPDLLSKTKHIWSGKDYLVWRLTNEISAEYSVATASQYFDIHKKAWATDILHKMQIDSSCLPPLRSGVNGIINLTPQARQDLNLPSSMAGVLPGLFDGGATAVALTAFAPGIGVSNFGTSAMLRVPSKKPICDASPRMALQNYFLFGDIHFVGGGLNNASLVLNWLSRLFQGIPVSELLSEAQASKPGSQGLLFMPYLTGERDPQFGNFASGAFIGGREFHTRGDFVRSALEGVAYTMRDVLDALTNCDLAVSHIVMAGGGTEVLLWQEILASTLNKKICTYKVPEAGLVGGAILGFTELGTFATLQEGHNNLRLETRETLPKSDLLERYEAAHETFISVRSTLIPAYAEHFRYIQQDGHLIGNVKN